MAKKLIYKVVIRERIGEFETYHESLVRGTLKQATSNANSKLREYYGKEYTRQDGDEFWDVSGERFASLSSVTPAAVEFFDVASGEYERIAVEEMVRLEAENGRLREALEHIAQGNISPAITFARHILAGDSVDKAHEKQSAKLSEPPMRTRYKF